MKGMTKTQSPVFDPDDEACHVALQQLRDVLDHLGFTVRKKTASEATLRVYPRGYGRYPLLNPRFHSHATYQGKRRRGGFLVLSVLSTGDDRLDHELRDFPSSTDCEFVAGGATDAVYLHHGDFVVPLKYSGKHGDEIDFRALGESLLKVRQHLREVQSPAPTSQQTG